MMEKRATKTVAALSVVLGISALLAACISGQHDVEFPSRGSAIAKARGAPAPLSALLAPVDLPADFRELDTDVGPVFANGAGLTFYLRTSAADPCKDENKTPGDDFDAARKLYASYAAPTCAQQWPPVLASADAHPVGDWSIVTRPEGAKQWAYKGHPVHLSHKDQLPGDVNGLGHSRFASANWAVATAPLNLPPGITTTLRQGVGLVAASSGGGPLYTLDESAAKLQKVAYGCGDKCSMDASVDARKWRPVSVSALATGPVGPWTILVQGDSSRIWGYEGRPTFTYVDDKVPTDIEGLAVEGADIVVLRPAPMAPPGFTVQRTVLGPVYAESRGMTVYMFVCNLPVPGTREVFGDTYDCDGWNADVAQREQFCPDSDKCAEMWHPVLAPPGTKPRGGTWGVATIPDAARHPLRWLPAGGAADEKPGAVQVWTYEGQPLYTFVEDAKPGEIWGASIHLSGQEWKVVHAGRTENSKF